MHNTTISFIYVHKSGTEYSYCNNLDNSWPLQDYAWKALKKQIKPCYSYAILNESFLAKSSSGHSYKPVCILMEIDSLEEAKAVNTAYYTGYRKIHEENLSHIEKRNEHLQEFVDQFAEQLVAYADFRKVEREELDERVRSAFTDFKDLEDFFNMDLQRVSLEDLDEEFGEDEEDDPIAKFFNISGM